MRFRDSVLSDEARGIDYKEKLSSVFFSPIRIK